MYRKMFVFICVYVCLYIYMYVYIYVYIWDWEDINFIIAFFSNEKNYYY